MHIGFESYKDEDIDVLILKDLIFQQVHKLQNGTTSSEVLRIDERQNYDHSNKQVYEQDYKVTIKDFLADKRPATPTVVGTLNLPITILP